MIKPRIFDPQKERLDEIKSRLEINSVIDTYKEQISELFFIRNPRYRFDKKYQTALYDFVKDHCAGKSMDEAGTWVYFPWNKLLVHYLPDALHQELRTARNRNLITADEQKKFYEWKIGIAGLSVGSHVALTIAMMGGGKMMRLADPDTISGSNLNRIRDDFTKIGVSKCESVAHAIYQINPYAELLLYQEGVTNSNAHQFLAGPPKVDVLVEEMDNLEMKIALRLEARKLEIPVVMATDNGDNIIFDIERYDMDRGMKPFNGALGDVTVEDFKNFPSIELPKLAAKVAGPHLAAPKMLASVLEVGKTLYSWPQLGDAATLAGAAVAYVVKRLALGEPVKSGKLEVNFDSIFDPEYFQAEKARERDAERKRLLRRLGF